ncbi:hypothetical protein D3C71_1282520 [compost metagenome]
MIVDDIHNNTHSTVMKALDQLLELPDSGRRFIRIGGIRALRNVIVLRIISPIVVGEVELRLIHAFRGVIIHRQQLHMSNAQVRDMIESG